MAAVSLVVVAPDKFRGSVTAREAAHHLAVGIAHAGLDIETRCLPVADGGEGTVEAALGAGFRAVPVRVRGPHGAPTDAVIAVRGRTAVVELAGASGLALTDTDHPDALGATSYGTGQLVAAALDEGCDDLVVGLGGSACTDGGAGMVRALGARVTDDEGDPVRPGGAGLRNVAGLDLSGLDPRLSTARVRVACDVDNPLLGSRGAARVYGPQKGAGPADVRVLEDGLGRWADVVASVLGPDLRWEPGAGAAGGVGFACLAVLNATLTPGIETMLSLLGFEALLAKAALVITGEGCIDDQTFHGKAPAGVSAAAERLGVPVVGVAGVSRLQPGDWRRLGLRRLYLLSDLEPDPRRSIRDAAELLERIGTQVALDQFWAIKHRAAPSDQRSLP